MEENLLGTLFSGLSRWQRLVIASLFLIIPSTLIAVYRPVGIFMDNQHLYYLTGMYEAGVDFLQNDPDASLRPIHVVFSKLVTVLYQLNWQTYGSQFLAAFLIAVMGWAFILMSIGITVSWRQRQKRDVSYRDLIIAMSIAALFGMIAHRNAFTYLDGMAGMNLVTKYLQASSFGVFVALGIGFVLLRSWRAATVSFIIASLMHSHFMILSGPMMLLIVYEKWRLGKLREGIILFGVFALAVLPLFVLGPLQWSQVNTDESLQLRLYVRGPHHYDVKYWWNVVELFRLIIMGLAAAFALWKLSAPLRNIILFYFAYISLGILFVWVTGNETVATLLPWRASSFTLPFAELLILAVVVLIVFEIVPQRFHPAMLVLISIGAVVNWLLLSPWQLGEAYVPHTTPEIEMVVEHTERDALILVPPRMDDGFRLYAERATFVIWKAPAYDFGEWYNRIEVADEMMTADYERQLALCAEYPFDYYLLPVDAPAADRVTVIDQTEEYLLVACPEN